MDFFPFCDSQLFEDLKILIDIQRISIHSLSMRFFYPTTAKILLTLLIVILTSPLYFHHINSLFNPNHLPSCWYTLPDGSIPRPCASPFRSFTYGVPVAIVTTFFYYILACTTIFFIQKNTSHKRKRK